jgi:mycothiol synthase
MTMAETAGTAGTVGKTGGADRTAVVRDLADVPPDAREDALQGVTDLLARAAAADGVEALGEAFVRGLTEDRGHRHLIAVTPRDRVLGILAVDEADADGTAEIAVDPDHRRQGIATALLQALAAASGPDRQINLWSHGDLAGARELAGVRDARIVRELLKMSVDCSDSSASHRADLLAGRAAAQERFAETGLTVLDHPSACDRFGAGTVDEEWVRVNNEAFAWHPEQGGWDVPRLRRERDTAWFDPAGVLMLWDTGDGDGDAPECLGFHWTKRPADDPHGEVYVVCLADAARGRGLGGPLTLLGIGYLIDGGAQAVDLYVEGDNAPAVATYRKLGFEVVHRDVVYRGIV